MAYVYLKHELIFITFFDFLRLGIILYMPHFNAETFKSRLKGNGANLAFNVNIIIIINKYLFKLLHFVK